MADVEAGKVDCVVIHTFDRLTRSLSGHAKLLALFRRYGVTAVTVLPTLFFVWGDSRASTGHCPEVHGVEEEVAGNLTPA